MVLPFSLSSFLEASSESSTRRPSSASLPPLSDSPPYLPSSRQLLQSCHLVHNSSFHPRRSAKNLSSSAGRSRRRFGSKARAPLPFPSHPNVHHPSTLAFLPHSFSSPWRKPPSPASFLLPATPWLVPLIRRSLVTKVGSSSDDSFPLWSSFEGGYGERDVGSLGSSAGTCLEKHPVVFRYRGLEGNPS